MKNFLINALNNLFGYANIDLYIISSRPEKEALYSKKQINKKKKENYNIYDMRNVLILAANKNRNKLDEKNYDTIFNSGILCNEYINLEENKVILYISKIDTSGWENLKRQPLSLIRAIILGYLSYYQNLYKDTGVSVTLHLYTRAKPNYLFPTSDDANNTDKHVLTDSELINWWIKTLSHYPKVFIPESGYWYCPTGERIGHLQTVMNENHNEDIKNALKINTSICPWTWGYPFEKSSYALETIPQFPDDPKNSLLHSKKRASLIHERTTVREFFEYLAIENLSGTVSACMILNILSSSEKKKDFKKNNSQVNIDKVDYDKLIDYVLSLNYALEEDAENSSKALHEYLQQLVKQKKIIHFNYKLNKEFEEEEEEEKEEEKEKGIKFSEAIHVNNLQGSIKRKNVNDIQGLIKKKKITSTQESNNNCINNLQGLVKRKKVTTSQDSANNINNIQGLLKRKNPTVQKSTNNVNDVQGLIKRKQK
jgi:hypothetical protein